MATRRQFLGGSALFVGASAIGATTLIQPAARKLDLLFLGGTGFIGPHQINYALGRGHTVTMFNRGSNAGLYGDRVEELTGDRDAKIGEGLKALVGTRRWDVVVDNSGYVPRHVKESAELLKGRCSRYVYTSTVAVYDFEAQPFVDNNGPLLPAPRPDTEEVTGETYGPLKAECDRIVQSIFGDKATIVRPTYVIGPGDSTDRFTYWVERFYKGGDIVCPVGPDVNFTAIDVRDLCDWLINLAENDTPGIFNGSGPQSPMSNREVMYALRAFNGGDIRLHWPSVERLTELDYPTPMFDRTEVSNGIDSSAAQRTGLRFRSLADSIRDIHEWWQSQSEQRRANARRWPTAEQERAVLARL
jgi:2'-hydroxyisoflavone reductase